MKMLMIFAAFAGTSYKARMSGKQETPIANRQQKRSIYQGEDDSTRGPLRLVKAKGMVMYSGRVSAEPTPRDVFQGFDRN